MEISENQEVTFETRFENRDYDRPFHTFSVTLRRLTNFLRNVTESRPYWWGGGIPRSLVQGGPAGTDRARRVVPGTVQPPGHASDPRTTHSGPCRAYGARFAVLGSPCAVGG